MEYLLDYCKISGKPVKEYKDEKKYVATGDINENKIMNYTIYSYKEKPSRANLIAEAGNVLFAKMQNTIKVLEINKDNQNNIYSTGFYSLEPNDKILSSYLYWYLNSDTFNIQKDNNSVGATMRGLNNEGLKKILIPQIPSCKEQKDRIDILNKIEKAIECKKEDIKKLDEYINSKFYELFDQRPYTDDEGIELKNIVIEGKEGMKRGPFGGSLKKKDFVENGYLVYEQRHAIHNDFAYEKYYIDEKKYKDMIGFAVKPKDLIISCSGVTLGRIAEIPETAKDGIINQALLRVTLDNTKMLNEFFIYLFRSEYIQNKLFGFSRGSGIPNFPSMKEVKEIKFFAPPINEQKKFAEILRLADEGKKNAEKDIDNLMELLKSKMYEYFKI